MATTSSAPYLLGMPLREQMLLKPDVVGLEAACEEIVRPSRRRAGLLNHVPVLARDVPATHLYCELIQSNATESSTRHALGAFR